MAKTLMTLPIYMSKDQIHCTVYVTLDDGQYHVYEIHSDGRNPTTRETWFNLPGDAFDNAFRRAGWNIRTVVDVR